MNRILKIENSMIKSKSIKFMDYLRFYFYLFLSKHLKGKRREKELDQLGEELRGGKGGQAPLD
jgi:hypothetical protein